MQTKVTGRDTAMDAAGFRQYMENELHPRHRGKLIESRYIGCTDAIELQLAIAEIAHGDQKIRRGPKLKHSAIEIEGGLPYEFELTLEERRRVENELVAKLDIVHGLISWHIGRPQNKKRWRMDFHILAANKDSRGRPLTARARGNLMLHCRAVVDRVHDEINQERRRANQPHIPAMREIRKKQRTEGRAMLVQKLAESEIEPTPLNIVAWLRINEMLGKRFSVENDEKAYVSVLYPPSGRARRERLKELGADVLAMRRELQSQAQVVPDRKTLVAKAKKVVLGQPPKNVKSK